MLCVGSDREGDTLKAQRRPEADFERISELPVAIKPFDPLSKQRSAIYRDRLNRLLAPLGARAAERRG